MSTRVPLNRPACGREISVAMIIEQLAEFSGNYSLRKEVFGSGCSGLAHRSVLPHSRRERSGCIPSLYRTAVLCCFVWPTTAFVFSVSSSF